MTAFSWHQVYKLFDDGCRDKLSLVKPKSRERTLLEAVVAWGRGGRAEKSVELTTYLGS